ncbi:aerotaxis receptor [Allopseudospirillum japonicum]|uniref:Aerotaxis receptor n=1 Tax=Allopseudospirillum japonicum TaxID=64971 RepID=A0A1H6Q0X2_9GAMM|nr:PAS domain-containing protein [Allopseudospirillum japonicum]SEI37498.1 aerotaxis receptor [Allopseudospirillum japonicum]
MNMAVRLHRQENEVLLKDDELIITKTDLKGKITYANRAFMRIAGYYESQLIGQPHNIIRHPDMPKAVFRLLWKSIQSEQEFFGIVKNYVSNGDYYWVLANITPDYDSQGKVKGYYSVRRRPHPRAVERMKPLYKKMLEIESRQSGHPGIQASLDYLLEQVHAERKDYQSFVLSLI